MKNATVMNVVQRIPKVFKEYLKNRKAANVGVMREETQYTHSEGVTFVNKNEAGNFKAKATKFGTIKIPGSDSHIYAELMKHEPANYEEMRLIYDLNEAISKQITEFNVVINDLSMDNNKPQFIPSSKHAVDYTNNESEKLAKENGPQFDTKDKYILFLGWLINSLINEGWSETAAWNVVSNMQL